MAETREKSANWKAAKIRALDLKHLRFAVAASDYGSLRRAADALSVRQSTLSRSIRQLEHQIGVPVFKRSNGGVNPTLAGRGVLRMARTILEEVEVLVVEAKSTRNGETGRLAVGFCTSLSEGNLRATLLDFRQRFPQIEVATVERSRTRLASALRSGVLDVMVVPGDMPLLNDQAIPLWSERILVVLPENHPLAAREAVYWTDLRNETVLLSQYDPGRKFEDLLVSKLISSADRPKIERPDVSRGIIKSLISMKTAVSLVLESDIGANFAGLVYRELRDGTGPSRFDYSAYWRADNENPALNAFLKVLSERYPSPRPGR